MSRYLIYLWLIGHASGLMAQVTSSSSSGVCIPTGTVMTIFGEHTFMEGITDIYQTDRSDANGSLLAFGSGSSWRGADDTGYVDGSIVRYEAGYFTFPTGANSMYRPLALSDGQDAIVSYHHNSPPSDDAISEDISNIMSNGYWYIQSSRRGRITLPYDRLMADDRLTILGYDGASWTAIPSQIDQTAVDMSTSTYRLTSSSNDLSGTITSTDSIAYGDYHYYTLGHLSDVVSSEHQLTVYPNPVAQNGLVIISYDLPVSSTSGTIAIMDQQERLIYRRDLHYGHGSLRIRLGGLQPGVYWIVLTDEHGVATHQQLIIMSR